MGEVYRAEDTKIGQTVALKFLPARLERDPVLLARLHDEVRLGRQIAHPNVCHLYDIIDWDGAHFVAMEYVDGEDLGRLLRRIGRLAPDKAVDFARGIAAGLAAAHAKGILHRDLKPANIMIDSRGDARIMDFGLALAAGEDDGTISGTPAYMAPEQLEGAPATVQSDLYALGLVMYELVTGKRAHNVRTLTERIRDASSQITTPSSVIRDMDPAVERVILRCLASDPEQRPASAREVIQALPGGDPLAAALMAGETPSPRIVAAAGSEGSLTPLAAWSLLALALGAFAAVFFLTLRDAHWRRSGLARPPEAQADRIAEMARRFGIDQQPYSAYGYTESAQHEAWLVLNDPARLHRPDRGLSMLRFWMREAPAPLYDSEFPHDPRPSFADPPQYVAGSWAIETDPRGRLLQLRAIAHARMRVRPLAWGELLQAAGLDPKTLKAAPVNFVPSTYADARAAWTGRYPEDGTPVRIEAAAWHGVPVHFQIVAPWDERDLRGQLPFGSGLFHIMGFAIIMTSVVVGSFVAWRNLRARRGDRPGATRIAGVLFAARLFSGIAIVEHEVSLLHELRIAVMACADALLVAAAWWLVYIAIEPYIRRRWPEGLISWVRLLGGKWRNPMVGRDILAGTAVGLVHWLVVATTPNVHALVHGQLLVPVAIGSVQQLGSTLAALGWVSHAVVSGAVQGLTIAVMVMLATLIARRRFPVGYVVAPLFFCLYLFASTDPVLLVTFAFLSTLFAYTVTRFGLLGIAAASAAFSALISFPVPDGLAWYTVRMIIPAVAVLATAAWAFRTSLGGQPLFQLDE
jgi:serine/threonine-protein kinase